MSRWHVAILDAPWREALPGAASPIKASSATSIDLKAFRELGAQRIVVVSVAKEKAIDTSVPQTHPPIEWIVHPAPISISGVCQALQQLAKDDARVLLSTMDALPSTPVLATFIRRASLLPDAVVVLGLCPPVEFEKPLRVAMRGESNTGLMPTRFEEDPEAFEVLAMTNIGFASDVVVSGLFFVRPSVFAEEAQALQKGAQNLRQFLGHLLKYGFRLYGVPLQ